MSNDGELTTIQYWENQWGKPPKMRLLPSRGPGTRNITRILRAHVKPGMRFLEIGCGPGRTLAWVAKKLKASVAGLDYSPSAIEAARPLFRALGLAGDLRCEDIFATTLEPARFDVVYSNGVIEHFRDPRELVRVHVTLTKPGGTSLMMIPNFAGLYGRIMNHFGDDILALHNLGIMSPAALKALAPAELVSNVRAYRYGRATAAFPFERKWPAAVGRIVRAAANALFLLQPCDVPALCPLLVLELTRKG